MSAPDWLLARPIAHRGLHDVARGIVENTISAAEAAIAGGFAIECDVQLSSDGEAVVFHDFILDRLTADHGKVEERSAAALGSMAVSGTADTIPTLSAFLDRIAGRVPVIVEIKSDFSGDDRLTRRTVDIVRTRSEPIAVKSFDPAIVNLVRQLAPALPRGIVGQSRYEGPEAEQLGDERRRSMTELLHWADTQPHFVSWRKLDLPAPSPHLARTLGRAPVMTWTIRSEAERNAVQPHSDQIIFEGFVPA